MKKLFLVICGILITGMVYRLFIYQSVKEKNVSTKTGSTSEIIRIDPDDETCSLQKKACLVTIPEIGKITFAITPREIRMNVPLEIKVITNGEKDVLLWVDFVGVDVNMGYNRIALSNSGSLVFLGEATLPACTSDAMTWQATVLLKYQDKMFGIPFEFITEKK